MKAFYRIFFLTIALLCAWRNLYSDNQTATVSPILPGTDLPFQIRIAHNSLILPNGLHSYAYAIHKDKWLLLAGRTNGLHGFNDDNYNFPPQRQNTTVYVVDLKEQCVYSKSLYDPSSGLSQYQIDTLSVTSPQSYQWKDTLYITGGYGVDSATGQFSTKDTLTAIDVPDMIHWVVHRNPEKSAVQSIRQICDPLVQVTGGYMTRVDNNLTLLIFGQNFTGYYRDTSNGDYTQQVRCFEIIDNGKNLEIIPKPSESPNPNYRRRDLNVVPIIQPSPFGLYPLNLALSGVFTLSGGAWTVPVSIYNDGSTFMPDPTDPDTFKQGMNNYASATMGLYSKDLSTMYITLFGGISFGYFKDGVFMTDPELPFINEVTTIQIDPAGQFTQYRMDNQYPIIPSLPNGKPLLFGAGAEFIPVEGLSTYANGVIKFDKIDSHEIHIGYIVGGIQSKEHNTNSSADSAASPYIFKVYLTKTE